MTVVNEYTILHNITKINIEYIRTDLKQWIHYHCV